MPQWTMEKSTRFNYTTERYKLRGSHGQRPWFKAHNYGARLIKAIVPEIRAA